MEIDAGGEDGGGGGVPSVDGALVVRLRKGSHRTLDVLDHLSIILSHGGTGEAYVLGIVVVIERDTHSRGGGGRIVRLAVDIGQHEEGKESHGM